MSSNEFDGFGIDTVAESLQIKYNPILKYIKKAQANESYNPVTIMQLSAALKAAAQYNIPIYRIKSQAANQAIQECLALLKQNLQSENPMVTPENPGQIAALNNETSIGFDAFDAACRNLSDPNNYQLAMAYAEASENPDSLLYMEMLDMADDLSSMDEFINQDGMEIAAGQGYDLNSGIEQATENRVDQWLSMEVRNQEIEQYYENNTTGNQDYFTESQSNILAIQDLMSDPLPLICNQAIDRTDALQKLAEETREYLKNRDKNFFEDDLAISVKGVMLSVNLSDLKNIQEMQAKIKQMTGMLKKLSKMKFAMNFKQMISPAKLAEKLLQSAARTVEKQALKRVALLQQEIFGPAKQFLMNWRNSQLQRKLESLDWQKAIDAANRTDKLAADLKTRSQKQTVAAATGGIAGTALTQTPSLNQDTTVPVVGGVAGAALSETQPLNETTAAMATVGVSTSALSQVTTVRQNALMGAASTGAGVATAVAGLKSTVGEQLGTVEKIAIGIIDLIEKMQIKTDEIVIDFCKATLGKQIEYRAKMESAKDIQWYRNLTRTADELENSLNSFTSDTLKDLTNGTNLDEFTAKIRSKLEDRKE